MKLSIIVPLKTVATDTIYYLKNKISSTIRDEIDYEVIVVVDETFKPDTDLLDYDEYKPYFEFISNKKPIGIFESRRKGLNKATGDIIWFVDSTDFTNFIQKDIIEIIKDFDVISFNPNFINEETNVNFVYNLTKNDDDSEYTKLKPSTNKHIIKNYLHPILGSYLFKTEYIKSVYKKLPKINNFNRFSSLYLLAAALKYMKSFKSAKFSIYSVVLKSKYCIDFKEKYIKFDRQPLFNMILNDVYFNKDDLTKLEDVLSLEESSIVSKEINEYINTYISLPGETKQ